MGLAAIIDEVMRPHGNRQGLSIGWTVVVWLSYILSQSDHRLSYVESWVKEQLPILKVLLSKPLSERDFTDDRLGDVLHYLSDDTVWQALEAKVGQQLVSVYELPCEQVHVDSTSVAVYHDASENALLEFGLSKDHRPDLAQFKVMQSSLGPFGLPVATLTVSGEQADDVLYLPVIEQSRKVLQRRGLLYSGDSKMEALQIRATLAAGGDFYLTPLSKKGKQEQLLDELLSAVWSQQQQLTEIRRQAVDSSEPPLLTQAFETVRPQSAVIKEKTVDWAERILVIYSPTLAEASKQALAQRLEQAQTALLALTPPPGRGKRQFCELPPLQAAVAAILERYQVADLLTITYLRHESQRTVRPYQERPARTETTVRYQLQLSPNAEAIQQQQRKLGWRLFVTNAPATQLSLQDAVLAYREAPRHEHNFSRLKNRPLGLRPLFLHRPDHMLGLVRLLSLALRILTVLEFVVRRELHQQQAVLTGLYEGNPHRSTQRPSTERLLRAFQSITLTSVVLPGQQILHLTPLTPLQAQILALLRLPLSLYTDLSSLPNPISL